MMLVVPLHINDPQKAGFLKKKLILYASTYFRTDWAFETNVLIQRTFLWMFYSKKLKDLVSQLLLSRNNKL